MPRENESYQNLHFTDYDISGNVFRAWKNDTGDLIFVLDETIDEFKPNVLLVIGRYEDRKWDDVLTNDYGINLEDVRPKVDNKYQKMDVEYSGLDLYAQLIDEYENGATDLNQTIADLIDFHDTAARRSAMMRLGNANEIIAQAQDTIARTENSIVNMRARQRSLREKLARQKNYIGREPTKQSAAKILKTESQIDSVTDKISRAEKRIENAQHRIDSATEDANAARELLARRRDKPTNVTTDDNVDAASDEPQYHFAVPAAKHRARASKKLDETMVSDDVDMGENENSNINVDENIEENITYFPVPDYEIEPQPRDAKMSDSEEVKPLLDEDPEILDEEIAFKPVEFEDIKPQVSQNNRPVSPMHSENTAQRSETEYTENVHTEPIGAADEDVVARPLSFSDSGRVDNGEYRDMEHGQNADSAPVINTIKSVDTPAPADADTTGRVTNAQYDNVSTNRPVPPQSTTEYTRPLSPITGGAVRPVGDKGSRSSVAYYILLIVLIVLSIFTLWLYQKKNGTSVPLLNAPADGIIENTDEMPTNYEYIGFENQDEDTKSTDAEPFEPDVPVVIDEPAPVVPQDEPINIVFPNNNVLRAAEPEVPVVESEEDVLARKEAYDVAMEDKPIYVPVPEPEPVVRVTNVTSPDVIFDEDVISVPVVPADYADEETYYQDEDMYYQDDGMYYDDNAQFGAQYDEYMQESGGFVDEPVQERTPEVQRHLTIHDGGQYSIGYTETTY